jgi:DNA-binding Lrp family transcriptional regulator
MVLDPEVSDRLAQAIQTAVPLVPEPFRQLAGSLDLEPETVLRQLRQWRDSKMLREISAVLEGEALGYDSALVAAEVPVRRLDEVVAVINEHPTVSHNYLRDHRYNVWFTLAVPETMGLERTLDILSSMTGVRFHTLRRTTTFKIGVRFRLGSLANDTSVVPLAAPCCFDPDRRQQQMLRALQRPLPIVPRPFQQLASEAGVTEEVLLAFASAHLGGVIRRYVGTFYHRRLGVRANGMVVWRAPEESLHQAGAVLAQSKRVSHCYARNPVEGFPYNLYSMLHGPDEASVRQEASILSRRTSLTDFLVLFSREEFKKCRLRYFQPELDRWWRERTGQEVLT